MFDNFYFTTERISFVLFFLALIPMFYAFLECLMEEEGILMGNSVIVTILKGLIFFVFLYAAYMAFTVFKIELLQNVGYVGILVGICLTLLTRLMKVEQFDSNPNYKKYFYWSLAIFFISAILYIILMPQHKTKLAPSAINDDSPIPISVFNLAATYTGTIKPLNSDEYFATIDILRILADQNSIIFEFSFTAHVNDGLHNYKGKGKILPDEQVIDFTGLTRCKIKFREKRIVLESDQNTNSDYWIFRKL